MPYKYGRSRFGQGIGVGGYPPISGPIVSPITAIAHTSAGSGDTSAVTSPAIDTTGATLLVVVTARFGSTMSVTDSKGNTYTALTDYLSGDAVQIHYCKNPTVGSGHTFTGTTAAGYPSISVGAFNNTDTTANADQSNGATSASASTLATGSVTPSTDNQLLVAGVAHDKAAQSINGGFTVLDSKAYSASNYIGSALAYLVQTTATAANPTWDTTTAGNICAAIATFKHS